MSRGLNTSVFDLFHPVVPCAYFTCALLFSMLAFHPVFIGLSLAAALAQHFCLCGARTTLRRFAWAVPLVLVVALFNPLVSSSGSTEMFRLGTRAVYAESLAYGACMGALLAAMLLWFANASVSLTSDKVMSLMAGALPTVSLMLAMALRLVPQLICRGSDIRRVQNANVPAGASATGKARLRVRMAQNARLVSTLMGWCMEDSLDTADAMRSRGWGSRAQRTKYLNYRFRMRDGIALALVVALAGVAAPFTCIACAQFSFYPCMGTFAAWWEYVACAVFFAVPLVLRVWWS